jgi:Family of unknown function (DUF6573)
MSDESEVISTYTRAQAIADGALIDLTDAEDRDGRRLSPFKFPVAMTATAFGETVSVGGEWQKDADGNETLVLPGCQDFAGRVWDVFWMLLVAIRQAPAGDTVKFTVSVLTDGVHKRETVNLKSICGPGDDGAPVITIMLPDED